LAAVSCLFWNIRKLALRERVAQLAAQHDAQLVILAECDIDPTAMISAFSSAGLGGFVFPYSPAADSDIRVFLRLPGCDLQPVQDDPNNHVSIRRMVFSEMRDLLLVVVHLQSKLSWSDDDQQTFAVRLAQKIAECEKDLNHRRTVVVGDLNMNPFEKGVIGCDGLHAVMTRSIAAKQSRIVDATERHFFYNPMRRFFGERSGGPPGTYFFANSGRTHSFFWNIFDQGDGTARARRSS
jgi:hypothetical protein